jgi:hypothetical protein
MQMALKTGYVNRPYKGETVSGDAGACWELPTRRVMALADGLGHGPHAHHAATLAMDCIAAHLHLGCAEIFAACHERLLNSRGAVLAVAVIDLASNVMSLGSVGNIRSQVLTASRVVRLGAGRGIVGASHAWTEPDQVTLSPGDVVVMFSDGVEEDAVVRACYTDATVTQQEAARRVLHQWGRDDDDASVLIYKHQQDAA